MNYPRIGVAAIIMAENRLLLIRRKGAHGAGTWAVPGGHLEFGESPAECAVREVFEETGITVRNPRSVALTNDIFPDENKHYITIWMAVECPAEPRVIPSDDEVEEWGWFSWDALPSPLFLPLNNLVNGRDVVISDIRTIDQPPGV